MKRKPFFFIAPLLMILSYLLMGYQDQESPDNFEEIVKVALRDAGNKLLLANNDSTSIILPITKINENRYEVAFERKLSIAPDSLASIITKSLKTANLPRRYIVEVINCQSKAVSFSFQIKGTSEKDIIPCIGRNLPSDCYTKMNHFLHRIETRLLL